jgi:hypothetical protein
MMFQAPIVVPDPPKPTYLPAAMAPEPPKPTYLPPGTDHFLPTMPPTEAPSTNTVINLLNFPPHVDSSFMPPELEAIKSSIDSNHDSSTELPSDDSSDEATDSPLSDLLNFPPNDISYLPPDEEEKEPENSYLPPASGVELKLSKPTAKDASPYVAPKDLMNFPPNIKSSYLPPRPFARSKDSLNSYLPPPSGDPDNSLPSETKPAPPPAALTPYQPPKNLFNFPPNIDSTYLPPEIMAMMMKAKVPINSYLPPASGGEEGETDSSDSLPPNHQPYVAPPDLHNFPPNIDSSYLPPEMKIPEVPDNSYLPPASGNQEDNPGGYVYMSPADSSSFSNGFGPAPPVPLKVPQYMYKPPSRPAYLPPPQAGTPTPSYMYIPPKPKTKQPGYSYQPLSGSVSGFEDGSKQNIPGPMPPAMMDPSMMAPAMMTAPAMMDQMMPSNGMEDMKDFAPPTGDDHHHHHHDYPDFIYDFDHHHHHHEEPPPEPTTTTEAPEEPRVKKYSYYYLGRKLWYIPLYFTLWFCLYVAALIIRSIGRHKVN